MEKRTDVEQNVFSLMLKIMLHPTKQTIATAIRHLRMILKTEVLPVSSIELRRFIWRFKNDNRLLWVYSRDGHRALYRELFPYDHDDHDVDKRLIRLACNQSKCLERLYRPEHTEIIAEWANGVQRDLVAALTSSGRMEV